MNSKFTNTNCYLKPKMMGLFLILSACLKVNGQVPALTFTVVPTSTIINPTYITNCKDDRLFIVEQDGRIRIKQPGVTALDTFMNINTRVNSSGNEQGLLSMAFHPNYKQNGYFYVNYTNNFSVGNTIISRFNVSATDSNRADPNSELILMNIYQPYSNHNGGQLQFGPDGYLYIGMGDGGSGGDPGNRAQNKDSLLGKILRINVDSGIPYSIPPDNPFINDTTVRGEIWTYGMRNPWRYSFDRLTGDLWIGDVGQNSYEEIDFQAAGTGGGDNYGWHCWEGTHQYTASSCTGVLNQHPPAYDYPHGTNYCSVTGGYIYRGALHPNLYGHYLFVDYCYSTFQSLKSNGAGGFTHYNLATLNGGNGFITTFGEDMDGELYVAAGNTGVIYKIGELHVSVNEINGIALTDVYPNPAKNQLHINADALHNQKTIFQIEDISGRILQQKDFILNEGKNNLELNIRNLEDGIYILNLKIDGAVLSRKFVVAK